MKPAVWCGLVAILLSVPLMWPALYNRQPFFFSDTAAYVRGADVGVQALFHRRSPWSLTGAEAIVAAPDGVSTQAPLKKTLMSISDKTVITGRSPFYGLLLYLGEVTGGFWVSIVLQSLAIVVSVALVLRALEMPCWPRLPRLILLLALTTSVPFFVSFLMPDVFAAVAVLGTAVLAGVRHRLGRLDYTAWWALLSTAAIFHDSHVLIIVSMLLLALVWNALTRDWRSWRGMAVMALSIVAALLAHALFDVIVERVVGAPPLRPPFLLARVIEDGPGYRYLRATCPDSRFTVCKYVDRLPLSAEDFLWYPDETRGVFAVASPAERRLLSAEQYSVLVKVITFDPWGQLSASLRNIGWQLTRMNLNVFQYQSQQRYVHGPEPVFLSRIPQEHLGALRRSAAYRGLMPIDTCAAVDAAVVAAAVAVLAFAFLRARWRTALPGSLARVVLCSIVAVVLNSAICGVFSGPHDRYSQRVAWVIPLVAMLVVSTLLEGRGQARGESGSGSAKEAAARQSLARR
jgi:hypothetical protein